ncbi:MAG: PepSY-associated TM helix domain-containing protein [Dehalococcoidia bacterium]
MSVAGPGGPLPEQPAGSEAEGADRGAVEGRSALYRAVWRWHFYIGIFVIPVLILLSLSGLVYLLKPQIDGLVYGDTRTVQPADSVVSYQEQLEHVQARFPDEPVVAVVPPVAEDRATEFYLDNGGTGGFLPAGRTVYVDPYSGDIVGSKNNAFDPSQIAVQVHGSLISAAWLGDEKWGDRLVELVASFTVLLLVTGVFLWWPRGRAGRSLRGTLIPRLDVKTRVRWRDMHAITGIVFVPVLAFFLLTGLAWAGVWGPSYGKVINAIGASYPAEIFDGVPSQTVGDVNGEGGRSWAQSALPALPSGGHANHSQGLAWNAADGAPLDAIVASVETMGFQPGYTIFFPADETDSYNAAQFPDGPRPNQSAFDERYAYIDQYTAEPLADAPFSQFGLMAKATDWGISLHEGREWGVLSQILMGVATLSLLVSIGTAVVMWVKRRPAGLGAPRRVYSRSALIGLLTITATLGMLFPLMGMALIGIIAFDYAVLRRLPPLARALGVAP